jgi:hypothetical protein
MDAWNVIHNLYRGSEQKVSDITMLPLCVSLGPFILLNQFLDFHEIWYEHYAHTSASYIVLCNSHDQ